ncbi:MAG: hypothetical protein ABI120_02325 [Gemmatimonadaceae bacterium]
MISIKPLRTLGVLAAAAFIVAATPAAKRVPGYTFESVTKAAISNPNAPAGTGGFGMTTRSIVTAAGASRMDVISVEGASQVYAIGDYIISRDGTMVLVHPATKTYVDLMAQATGAMASLPPQLISQMTITDVTGKSEKIGDETIEGRPTEHRRVTIGYAMGVMGQSIPTTITTDYWLAKISAQIFNPLAPPKTEATLALAGPAMLELGRKTIELSPKPTDGVPMKMVIETAASMMGRSMGTTITTEVKNLKEGDVDASLIVVPADYTKAAK